MTLSGGGWGCRVDIIAHTSSELSCGVNWTMDVGNTHLLASGVTYNNKLLHLHIHSFIHTAHILFGGHPVEWPQNQ